MRLWKLSVLSLVGAALCGCNRAPTASPFTAGGRGPYASVGIYSPGRQWTRLIANQQAKDPDVARPVDDQVVIVVQNSATGEVRACGDLTGYCIGMNPWKATLLSAQISPVKLTRHQALDDQGGVTDSIVKSEKAPR
jgi:hypothetical protein